MHGTLTRAACLALLTVVASGCATSREDRNLIITEVGKREVELYVDQPANTALLLGDGMKLSVRTASGAVNTVDFGAFEGTIPGGGFLVIWEGSGYNGPPVREAFASGQQGAVPGIKVERRFFDDIDASPAEIRLHGHHSRAVGVVAIFPRIVEDHIDDVLRFGQPPADRPATGGTFQANGSLAFPTGSWSHQRVWSSGAPRDTDNEDDWRSGPTSWGVPTP